MAYVRRANVVLDVKESEVQRFVDMGYDLLDDNGFVVSKSVPNDTAALRKAFMDHEAEISKLNAIIDGLKAELEEAKASKAEPKKDESPAVTESKPSVEDKTPKADDAEDTKPQADNAESETPEVADKPAKSRRKNSKKISE